MANGMKVHILHCGYLHGDKTNLVLLPGETIASRANPNMATKWIAVPTHAVLVEHPEGRLLWDNSCPRDWEDRWGPSGMADFFPYDAVEENEYFDARLKQLGVGPEDIDINVLSHLHFDHSGHTRMLADAGARILVHADEKENALAFEGPSKGAHLKVDYQGVDMEAVSGDTEILPGVTLLETPGHTWGTMSMQVDLPNEGTVIFTSDAVYLRESWGPPPYGAAIVWDNRKWLESVEKLRSIAERTNATVIFGHDPDQIKEVKRAPDAYYS